MQALITTLKERMAVLSRAVLDEAWRDPFWDERYGARGRKHAEQDANYHLIYLTQALTAGDASSLVEYGRWLRSLLTSRGMCTLHLQEDFDRLARAIAREPDIDPGPALQFLEEARAALTYESGPGRELQLVSERLAGDAAAALYAAHPELIERGGAEGRARSLSTLRHLISYLADALAAGTPAGFLHHAAFLQVHLARRGGPPSTLEPLIDSLEQALTRQEGLSTTLLEQAGAWLSRARALETHTAGSSG